MRTPINPGWTRNPRAGRPQEDHRLTFEPATRIGNLLFISGITAVDAHGHLVAPGDIAAQARHIYHRIGQILEHAGASFHDIAKTVDYVTTTDGYRETAQVRRDVFGDRPPGGFPAATGVIVAGLLRPGALIEIDAIAVIPDPEPQP